MYSEIGAAETARFWVFASCESPFPPSILFLAACANAAVAGATRHSFDAKIKKFLAAGKGVRQEKVSGTFIKWFLTPGMWFYLK